MPISLAGFAPELIPLIQDNTLQRLFLESLLPRQLFRLEAQPEEWEANVGEQMIFTRTGDLPINIHPLIPGQDPIPTTYGSEQWIAECYQYGNSIDTHMPTSRTTLVPKFAQDTIKLGRNAGQTLNQLVRNSLFRAYLGGNTVAVHEVGAGAREILVASLNGFQEILADGRPVPVSPSAPLAVEFPGSTIERNAVIGATPSDPNAPFGPGILTLQNAINADMESRQPVLAETRSRILRTNWGNSIDSIDSESNFTMQSIINAKQMLSAQNVPPHPDGYYHCHLNSQAVAQIFRDPQWQQLFTSLPESSQYQDLALGQVLRCIHIENTENPGIYNSGLLVDPSGGSSLARTAPEIGAEMINDSGVQIGRVIITGGGTIYEKYVPESTDYMSEAGVTGKIGNFSVINNGVQVITDRIRFILRSPLDRLQQVISQSWSWSGDFPIPSDGLSGNTARFKRAVIIEHSI